MKHDGSLMEVNRMKQKTNYPVQLTEDVYWKLAELKLQQRMRSTDEVLRVLLGMPENNTRVHRSSEDYATGYDGVNAARAPVTTQADREKCRTV
jgi:hypothetical protein